MVSKFTNDESTQSKQVLEFLTITSRPQANEESRRLVRSHAIRDANRRKRNPEQEIKVNAPDFSSKPPAQSRFTTKFRLFDISKAKKVSRIAVPQEDGTLPKGGRLKVTVKKHEAGAEDQKYCVALISPISSAFDPFDTLPVNIGSKQHALLEYQSTSLKQNAFAYYSKDMMLYYAAADAAWLNATLSLISLHQDLKKGRGLSRECLFHRGEALRIVNERLKMSPRCVSDATVGAIACLANFDTTNGLFSTATMHINGLKEILSSRDDVRQYGLVALGNGGQVELLKKSVAWTDMCYSNVWNLPPQFPLLATKDCSAQLADYIEVFLPLFTRPPNIYSSHDLFGEMAEIFQALRLLSIVMAQNTISDKHQQLFTRGLYIVEYKLLVVLDQIDPRDDDIVIDRNSQIYGSCRLAAYLYLYLALREVPQTAEIIQTLGRRLKDVLEANDATLLAAWGNELHMLHWICFMGAIASLGLAERSFFIRILKTIGPHLDIESLGCFQDALREVLYIEDNCWISATASIWRDCSTSMNGTGLESIS